MTIKRQIPESGEVYQVPYPFVRDSTTVWDEEGSSTEPTWKPGTRFIAYGQDDQEAVADGMGKQILTIIDTFKPGDWPRRVFYMRRWADPDGKEFGKDRCRVTTIHAFRSLVNGYRHPFRIFTDHKAIAELIGYVEEGK